MPNVGDADANVWDDDLEGVTALEMLDPDRIDLVKGPASGFGFLVMKATGPVDDARHARMRAVLADPAKRAIVSKALTELQRTLERESLVAAAREGFAKALRTPAPTPPARRRR